nr:MAG TPA: hypothetical protein [Caudoviricetes sp.]DAR69283.1 MAG TPA: hypothetical protein [Caudoviricetes sp.]
MVIVDLAVVSWSGSIATPSAISLASPLSVDIRYRSLIYNRSLMNCCTFPYRLDYIIISKKIESSAFPPTWVYSTPFKKNQAIY